MSGTLYVVGTPIGNLSDWSPRAVDTLGTVDFIAAEDTRVTLKLLNHFGIKKEMVSYYEHNRRERGEIITARIAAGEPKSSLHSERNWKRERKPRKVKNEPTGSVRLAVRWNRFLAVRLRRKIYQS